MPQPNLVPTRPANSRSTHSSGVSPGTSKRRSSPLIFSWIMSLRSAVSSTGPECRLASLVPILFQPGPDPVRFHNDDAQRTELSSHEAGTRSNNRPTSRPEKFGWICVALLLRHLAAVRLRHLL